MTLRFEIILINSTLYLKLYGTTSDTRTTDLIVLVSLENLAKYEMFGLMQLLGFSYIDFAIGSK